jgi:tetratricopeptide (TPR) repeat protein
MRECLVLAAAAVLLAGGPAYAQSVRSLVNQGNGLYRDQKFNDAEVDYRKALEKEEGLVQGHFNLGNALHKQGKFDEAVKEYEEAMGKAQETDTKAYAHYNVGNSRMKEQKFEDAVRSYVETLKLKPSDEEARYNLSYALEKLKVQQQQQQQQNKQKQNQDKNKQQQKDQQKEPRQQPDKQQAQQRPQSGQQEKKISRADAERILAVLKNAEKDVQKKLHARQAVRPKTDKDW